MGATSQIEIVLVLFQTNLIIHLLYLSTYLLYQLFVYIELYRKKIKKPVLYSTLDHILK